jgi:hypothetical protein
LCRPAVSAALSLAMIVALILLAAQIRHDLMTATSSICGSSALIRSVSFTVIPDPIAGLLSRWPWRCRRSA